MTEHHLTAYHDVHRALCNPQLVQALYDAGGVVMDDVLLQHGAMADPAASPRIDVSAQRGNWGAYRIVFGAAA